MHKDPHWYKTAVAYQIYTRSFFDSNNDGIGDIGGITQKLDYLQNLGVDIIWISPFCDSPNKDNGYDVSDYKAVLKEAGTIDELRKLIGETHKRGMSIMMDLVLNHSSDQHPWFIESRSSTSSAKRDWYFWAKGRGKNPPNNWQSYFGGPSWTYDEATDEWYLHHFFKEQPDLNWQNSDLRAEIASIVQFWIDEGIDAFRLDAIHHIGKPKNLPDAKPVKGVGNELLMFKNTPETHTYLRELAQKTFRPSFTFSVGETGGTTPKKARDYTDAKHAELEMIFHFDHTFGLRHGEWDMKKAHKDIFKWYKELSKGDGWDTVFLSNHDLPRQVSIMGNDNQFHNQSAKALAVYVLSQWGTPFIYQGEEIGMTNVYFENFDDYRDDASKAWYQRDLDERMDRKKAYQRFLDINRDNARTPFQWDDGKNAGFSSANPWIKPNPNFATINATSQVGQSDSIFEFYRRLIGLRKSNRVLSLGSMHKWLGPHEKALGFKRKLEGAQAWVVINRSSDHVELKHTLPKNANLAISNYPESASSSLSLRPWEARIYLFK